MPTSPARDGADLARALVAHSDCSIEAAEDAAEGIESAFAPDSAEQALTHMTRNH